MNDSNRIDSSEETWAAAPFAPRPVAGLRLKVGRDGRRIETTDGKPFFYLGDTAWLIFQRVNVEEAEVYLQDRAAKGFTVIQSYLVRGLGEVHPDGVRSLLGEPPFVGRDPRKPNELYFDRVDRIVRRANELGMVMALVTAKSWHVNEHPERVFDVASAFEFGRFLGRRYRDRAVVWYVGGDSAPGQEEALWVSMARGLREGMGGEQLVSYHGCGGSSSSQWFHEADWLDFNSIQSGHGWGARTYEFIRNDRARVPAKPTVDMEPPYENHPAFASYLEVPSGGRDARIDSHQVRQGAYWAMLAGAAGHGYGALDLFYMYNDADGPFPRDGYLSWRDALAYEGSRQLGFMRRLLEACDWSNLEPDPTLVANDHADPADHVECARSRDGSVAVAYMPRGKPIGIDMTRLAGKPVQVSWFNPRSGALSEGADLPATGTHEFECPTSGDKEDWVLVLDSRSR